MQKTLLERCGQEAIRHIKPVLCQIPGCTPQATEEYLQQLHQPLKQFEAFYKVLSLAHLYRFSHTDPSLIFFWNVLRASSRPSSSR